jgi:DNA polymerase III sliding clamp (beta) subunit (PCNA family)
MTLIKTSQFRTFIDAIGCLTDCCRLHVSPNGLHVITVDSANIALVEAELKVEGLPDLTPAIRLIE